MEMIDSGLGLCSLCVCSVACQDSTPSSYSYMPFSILGNKRRALLRGIKQDKLSFGVVYTLSRFVFRRKGYHFVDMADTNREPTEDSTRESLIAISYGMPEAEQPAAMSPKNTSNEKSGDTPWGNGDGDEKYRSKLISISCSPSPDMKAQPQPQLLLPVEHDA